MQHVVSGGHVDPAGGLIEQEQFGISKQGTREEHSLLLATAQVADVALGKIRDAQAHEHGFDGSALVRGDPWREGGLRPCHQHAFGHGDGKFQLMVSNWGT